MTLESRNSPLLASGSLAHVFVTSRNYTLLGNGSASTPPWQRISTENRITGYVRHGDLYSVRPEVIKECSGGVVGGDEK
jgi:hypothetical protein